jgi:hypothetical protein
LTVNVPSIETSLRRTLTMGFRFGLKGAVNASLNASIMWSNQVFFGLIMMGLPVVLMIGVSPAGSFPPVSRLEVFNGEVSFSVVLFRLVFSGYHQGFRGAVGAYFWVIE